MSCSFWTCLHCTAFHSELKQSPVSNLLMRARYLARQMRLLKRIARKVRAAYLTLCALCLMKQLGFLSSISFNNITTILVVAKQLYIPNQIFDSLTKADILLDSERYLYSDYNSNCRSFSLCMHLFINMKEHRVLKNRFHIFLIKGGC